MVTSPCFFFENLVLDGDLDDGFTLGGFVSRTCSAREDDFVDCLEISGASSFALLYSQPDSAFCDFVSFGFVASIFF